MVAAGGGRVHVKLDSGMGRLGTRDPPRPRGCAAAARGRPACELAGAMTHFATADDLDDDGFFAAPAGAVHAWVDGRSRPSSPELLVHAANSAAMLREAEAQFDMVRCGIAIYGMDPFGARPGRAGARAGA